MTSFLVCCLHLEKTAFLTCFCWLLVEASVTKPFFPFFHTKIFKEATEMFPLSKYNPGGSFLDGIFNSFFFQKTSIYEKLENKGSILHFKHHHGNQILSQEQDI